MALYINFIFPLLLGVLAESLVIKLFARLLRVSFISWPHAIVFSFLVTLAAIALRQVPLPLATNLSLSAVVMGSVVFHAGFGMLFFSRVRSSTGQPVGYPRAAGVAALSFLSVATLFFLLVKMTASLAVP